MSPPAGRGHPPSFATLESKLIKHLPEWDFFGQACDLVWVVYGRTFSPPQGVAPWDPRLGSFRRLGYPPKVSYRLFAAKFADAEIDPVTKQATTVWLHLLDSRAHFKRAVTIPFVRREWLHLMHPGEFREQVTTYNLDNLTPAKEWTLWGFLPVQKEADMIIFSRLHRGEDIRHVLGGRSLPGQLGSIASFRRPHPSLGSGCLH